MPRCLGAVEAGGACPLNDWQPRKKGIA